MACPVESRNTAQASIYNIFRFTATDQIVIDITTRSVTTLCFHSVNRLATLLARTMVANTKRESADMGFLYNANLTPTMNDISVTSGNADGWVYSQVSPVEVSLPRSAAESARWTPDGRTVVGGKSPKPGKR
jgi:hypothetical protein